MATSAELQAVQQGILRKKNVAEADLEAASGTTVAQYTEVLIERAETSTEPVLIMFDAITGKVPTSAQLDNLSVNFAQQQFDAYANQGVANPEIGPYEALGRALSSTAGFHAQSDGKSDGQFIIDAYVKAFGTSPGTPQVQHFQAQIDYFTALYTGAGIPAAEAANQARGAVFGQIFGIAALVEDGPLDTAAENFLRGTVTGTAIYDAPLSASQPAGPDPDQQIFTLTQQTDAGADFFGDVGDDIYNAEVIQTGLLPIQTLNSTDNLDGGDGRDTLNAQLVNAFTVPAGLKSIEVLNIDGAPGFITPPVTLDVVNADSIDTIGFRAPTNNVTVTNLKTALSEINISNEKGGLVNTIVAVGTALSGTSDEVTINVNNVGQGAGAVTLALAGTGSYETLNVNSKGGITNDLTITGAAAAAATATLAGDTDLNVNSTAGTAWNIANLHTLDASALEANLNTDFGGTGNVTVLGGSKVDDLTFRTSGPVTASGNDGDDIIRLGLDDDFLATGGPSTLNGDAGNDTLLILTDGAVTANGGTGDDLIRFHELNGGVTFSAVDNANGGEGNDLLVIEADNNNSVLLGAGVGAHITGIETIRHDGTFGGNINLSVNMAETGSANTVVLAGSGALGGGDYNVVNVTNMTNAQTLVIQDDVAGDVELNHAPGIIQTFNITLNGGVTVGSLDAEANNPVGEVDGIFINSIGGGTNVILDAEEMDTDIGVTGTTNLQIGSNAAGLRYDVNNGLISAAVTGQPVFSGNLTVFADGSHQTIVGGSGSDLIDSLGGNDVINLTNGGNDIVVFRTLSDISGAVDFANTANFTHVVNFSNDVLRFDVSDLGALENANGGTAAGATLMQLQGFNEVNNADNTAANYVKLTTAVTGAGLDGQSAFNAAMGGGTLTVDAATDDMLVSVYDATHGVAVFMRVDADDNNGTLLQAGDDADVIALVSMTQAQYDAFNGSNISLV